MKRFIPILFVLAGCLLLTCGIVAVGVAVTGVGRPSADVPDAFAWKPPMEYADTTAMSPATVILPLTGMDPVDALGAALDKAHLENAFAIAAYDVNLNDAARIGAFLQLGTRYAKAKDNRKATIAYQSAVLLATLSPAVSDPARMDTYLQASNGLRDLGAIDAARLVVDQAYLVAQYSNAMRREARARRLNQVVDAYTALGVPKLADQARGKAGDALTEPGESSTTTTRVPFSPAGGKLPAVPELDKAIKTRIDAAKALAGDLNDNPPKSLTAWPKDLVADLTDALVNEDDLRANYYNQQIPKTKDAAVLIALWRDKVAWLALKNRAARGAFGYNLVPEWAKDKAGIAGDLSDAFNELARLQTTQAAVLAKPVDKAQANEDVVKQQLIAVRWGWISAASEPDVRDAMDGAEQQMQKAPINALRVDVLTRNSKTTYFLVPDDLYGQDAKALPK